MRNDTLMGKLAKFILLASILILALPIGPSRADGGPRRFDRADGGTRESRRFPLLAAGKQERSDAAREESRRTLLPGRKIRIVVLTEKVSGMNAPEYPMFEERLSQYFFRNLKKVKGLDVIIDEKSQVGFDAEKAKSIAAKHKADYALILDVVVNSSAFNNYADSLSGRLIDVRKGEAADFSLENIEFMRGSLSFDRFNYYDYLKSVFEMFSKKALPIFRQRQASRELALKGKSPAQTQNAARRNQPRPPEKSTASASSRDIRRPAQQTSPAGDAGGFRVPEKKSKEIAKADRAGEAPRFPKQETSVKGQGSRSVPIPNSIYRNSWGLVIGINRYRNSSIPSLNYSRNDATAIKKLLLDKGFEPDKIITLLDQKATKENILRALNSTLVRRTTDQDRLVIFFAGHGYTKNLPGGRGEEGYLLPHDADLNDLAFTALSMRSIRQITDRIPAKHILLMADACYSGFSITRRAVGSEALEDKYLELITNSRSVQVITAGRRDQPVTEESGHGIFTKHLISALEGFGDLNGDGLITASEIGAYIHPRVARDSGNQQDPQFGNLSGEGQFVFSVGLSTRKKMDMLKNLYYKGDISPAQLEKGLKLLESGQENRLLNDYFNGKLSLSTFRKIF